jgi:MFS family permease
MDKAQNAGAAAEWRAHWPLVVSAFAGVSLGTAPVYAIGLFMQPLQHEFGWKSAQVTSGLMVFALVSTVLSPFGGALIDRFGTRILALIGAPMVGLAIAAFGLTNSAPVTWWGLWALFACGTLVASMTLWTAAVSSRFKAGRGLALAATLCGVALGASLSPLLTRWLIDSFGWRLAFAYLGLGWASVVLALVIPFFRDARALGRREAASAEVAAAPAAPETLPGLSFGETLRSSVFIRLALTQGLFALQLMAIVVLLVPILGDMGHSRAAAAGIVSAYGFAGFAGKLSAGWVQDRVRGPAPAGLFISLLAVTCIVLLTAGASAPAAVLAVAVLGFCGGANIAAVTDLTTHYIGMRSYGKAYGVLNSLYCLAAGAGPLLGSMIHDQFHGYRELLMAGVPVALICGGVTATLGRYPKLASETPAAETDPTRLTA